MRLQRLLAVGGGAHGAAAGRERLAQDAAQVRVVVGDHHRAFAGAPRRPAHHLHRLLQRHRLA